ncbi:MAG: hypothetical protein QOD41_4553 [Cryptosporangiaceae bacterium]|nr:hypothetical protein [Cryptosporangiaceae bacterium]
MRRLGCVALLAVLAAACASPARPATRAAMTTSLGGTDVAWTQLMIPMTAQAVSLLGLTAARASSPGLPALATRLRSDYRADLARLRAVLSRAGIAETHEHDGHDLPGMVTPADLAAIGAGTGPGFDALAARHLREEMEQSVRLARSEQRSGHSPECTALAASIERARGSALARLSAVIGP